LNLPAPSQSPDKPASAGKRFTTTSGAIELHLEDLAELFDPMDPSPLHAKDLDRKAEEYIVESVKELPARTRCEVVIHLDQPSGLPDEQQAVAAAIHGYFEGRSRVLQRNLRQLLRRGLVSLAIGIAFLTTLFIIAQLVVRGLGESDFAALVREGLIIFGWVAMWRPLEIFLYDWWPIVGDRRIYDRLSRIDVRTVHHPAGQPAC
jgi:hypothetical protein